MTDVSPLAPRSQPDLPPIDGVRLGACAAGIKYRDRDDLMMMVFDHPVSMAGVFTRSRCASAPVDWCREQLGDDGGIARAIVVNSGNANAFTGQKGAEATRLTADIAAKSVGCGSSDILLASTGVIGEPLEVEPFADKLADLAGQVRQDGWAGAAAAIMTTDTFPKQATRRVTVAGHNVTINGIAKGSGMIAPDMATMLGFVVTDAAIEPALLQTMLRSVSDETFNAITVDSDTSTSDTVLMAATGSVASARIDDIATDDGRAFVDALRDVMQDLALQIVRDGEGASKLIEICVKGAESDESAKRIALCIANSPLVKTAIAGEDANWGRVVMAVGKAGEPADRDRLSIWFGDVQVAREGERDPNYDEAEASAVMKLDEIALTVDLGLRSGSATVWTCDLTHGYISINADYRS